MVLASVHPVMAGVKNTRVHIERHIMITATFGVALAIAMLFFFLHLIRLPSHPKKHPISAQRPQRKDMHLLLLICRWFPGLLNGKEPADT